MLSVLDDLDDMGGLTGTGLTNCVLAMTVVKPTSVGASLELDPVEKELAGLLAVGWMTDAGTLPLDGALLADALPDEATVEGALPDDALLTDAVGCTTVAGMLPLDGALLDNAVLVETPLLKAPLKEATFAEAVGCTTKVGIPLEGAVPEEAALEEVLLGAELLDAPRLEEALLLEAVGETSDTGMLPVDAALLPVPVIDVDGELEADLEDIPAREEVV